jgi:5-methyltetrahydrofolate--homocysteine methyltransferase
VQLQGKPDLDGVRERWRALYEHEIIDRPVTCITLPRDPANPPQPPTYLTEVHRGIDVALDAVDTYCAGTLYLGDAIPSWKPSIGPDQFAAFLGTEIHYSPDSANTSWAVPWVSSWENALPLCLQEASEPWQFMQQAVRRTAERGEGRYLCQMLDLHTGADALAGMRGAQQLIYDIVDRPEWVERALADVRVAFYPVYDRIYELGRMAERGSIRGIYSEGRTNIVACDFAALLSPELFRRFVLPQIEDEAEYLDHSIFHIDGPDMLPHLEAILSVPGIDAINWVPGSQNRHRRFASWTELFHRVQKAGKIMQIYGVNAEEVKALAKELRPELLYFSRVEVESREEAEELLHWLTVHT